MVSLAGPLERMINKCLLYTPSLVACLCFLPCGFVFGYTIFAFVVEHHLDGGLGIELYGPLILGGCWGLVMAITMFAMKNFKQRIVFWHQKILLAAGVFHLVASCFYFANGFDSVGAFISYLAHSITFLASLSFLHTILGRKSRAIFLTICFSFYLLGTASAVSLIGERYNHNSAGNSTTTDKRNADGIYINFAAAYLSISIFMMVVLVGLTVLTYLGVVDCKNSIDHDLYVANSNGSIFEKRENIIKRIQFFYVTKNKQWSVTALLMYIEAIQYSIFVYFVFWFAMNDAVRLTSIGNIDQMLWIVFAGSVVSIISLCFVSAKVNYVACQICLLILTVLSMIVCKPNSSNVPFWLILFIFGICFSNMQIVLVEVSHFRFTELLIYTSYALSLLSTSMIYYFAANSKNSFFYSKDTSTLMAQGCVFIIITSLMALVVGLMVPRTHRTSLFDIQYGLLGIIFKKHQIEQLNVKWLNDGTIPTISRPAEQIS